MHIVSRKSMTIYSRARCSRDVFIGVLFLAIGLALTMSPCRGATNVCPTLMHPNGNGHALPINLDMSVDPPQSVPVVVTFDHDEGSYTLLDPSSSAGAIRQEPTSWTISPKGTTKVQIAPAHNGPNPGVIWLSVKVSGIEPLKDCKSLDTAWSINTGIDRVARFRVRGEGFSCEDDCDSSGTSAPITVHDHTRFTVSLLGTDKGPFVLSGPVTLRAQSADADLSGNGGKTWVTPDTSNPAGGTIGPGNPHASFEVVPGWHPKGAITIDATLDGSQAVMKADLIYRTVAPWWIFLPACLLGAMMYVVFEVLLSVGGDLRKFPVEFSQNGFAKPILGLAAGFLGWILKETNLVDLKITSSDSLGYLVLGASFAALGIEGLFKAFKRNATVSSAAAANATSTSPPSGGAAV